MRLTPSPAWLLSALLGAALACAIPGCQSPDAPEPPNGDSTEPQVSETLPAANAVGVSTQASITVVFNEPVNPATVGLQNFVVTASGGDVAGAIVTDGSGRRFSFVPDESLPENRQIDVEVTGVVDQWGNMLESPYRFNFHTEGDAPVPPRVPNNPAPANGAGDVAVDATFTWQGGSDTGEDVDYDFWLGRSVSSLELLANDLEGTEFTPGSLTNSTDYVWRIVAQSASGTTQGPNWTFTTVDSPDPNQPPEVPCNPVPANDATEVAVNAVLHWGCKTDPDGDTVSFDVYFGTASDPPLVATAPDSPYNPPGDLEQGTRYYWRIEARDEQGAVSASPVWHFDTVPPPVPNDPPSAPAPPITPVDGGTVLGVTTLLTWSGGDDPDGDPVSYLVRFGTANPPPNLRTVSIKSTLSPALAFSTTYYWQIVARDDHDHETPGPVWSFSTLGAPNQNPSAPCNLSPANNADDVPVGVTLTWECGTDPDSDPVTFVVYLERNGGSNPDSVATTTERSYTPPAPLAFSSHYTWRVRARDNRGGQALSQLRTFDTEAANQPPTSPCNPNPYDGNTDTSPDDVRLRWGCGQDPDDDPETYDVYFGTTPDPTFIDSTGSRNYLLGGLEPFTLYYWKIVARDNRGGITEGPVWSFTTRGTGSPRPSPALDH